MQVRQGRFQIKIPIYFLGMAISCLGTAILNLNALGSDAMNTLFTAIAEHVHVMPGNIYTIFNTSMLVVGFLFARRYMGIASLLMILVQGYFINFSMNILATMPWLFQGVVFKTVSAVAGHLCRTFGGALSTSMCLGTAGFEAFLFATADRIRIEYKYLKMASEILFFVAALFLHGVFGIMTIASVFLYGPTLSFFMIRLNATLWKRLGIADERNNLARNRRKPNR